MKRFMRPGESFAHSTRPEETDIERSVAETTVPAASIASPTARIRRSAVCVGVNSTANECLYAYRAVVSSWFGNRRWTRPPMINPLPTAELSIRTIARRRSRRTRFYTLLTAKMKRERFGAIRFGQRTTVTGHGERRTTVSATLPSRIRETPSRPWLPITT